MVRSAYKVTMATTTKGISSALCSAFQNKKCASWRPAFLAALMLTAVTDASALMDDQLELFVATTVTHDNNIFRISDDVDPAPLIGTSGRSDTFTTLTTGLNFDVPVSRQRFQGGFNVSALNYNRFGDLDHTEHQGRAAWLWRLGNDLDGQVGYTETKTLASFSTFVIPVANLLKIQKLYANANYMIGANWQLQGGLLETHQRNENRLRKENDVDIASGDINLNYITATKNSIGLNLHRDEGKYRNDQIVLGQPIDNAYTQNSAGLVGNWTLSGKSHIAARIDRIRRDYDEVPQRDFDGTTWRVVYDWKATGKLTLTAIAHRDIAPEEDIQTSFVRIKGFSLIPSYVITDQLRLIAVLDHSERDYLGDPRLALTPSFNRNETVKTAVLTLEYKPTRTLTFALVGRHEDRNSNLPLQHYDANVVSLNARLGF